MKAAPNATWALLCELWMHDDQDVINKCGLDAYFFLRYLKTMLVIFLPILLFVTPTLSVLNFNDGRGQAINSEEGHGASQVTGLDVLAWGNVKPGNTNRYNAHFFLATGTVVWVCTVFFLELKVYIKVRQDYISNPKHRLRASATTILVSSVPPKWLSEDALSGLFDIYPGGVRNIWLNRDYSRLLEKILERKKVHTMLEIAETALIRAANKVYHAKHHPHARSRPILRSDSPKTGVSDASWIGKVLSTINRTVDGASQNMQRALADTNGFRPLETPNTSQNYYQATFLRDDHQTGTTSRVQTAQGQCSNAPTYEQTRWWQFWRPPSGSLSTPSPQGYTYKKSQKSMLRQALDAVLPSDRNETQSYPPYRNNKSTATGAEEWRKHIEAGERPTHWLPMFGRKWLPGIPLISTKTDTIYWCREELARLNMEIEDDQAHPERYPLISSAFIQFNRQVAAHMACQTQTYHLPEYMAPRSTEISPRDIIWSNMALSWWEEWFRTIIVLCALGLVTSAWSIPVASSGAISQLHELTKTTTWLAPAIENQHMENFVRVVAGVAPSIMLGVLLYLVPLILGYLAELKGNKTRAQQIEFVQTFFFIFLFIQVFLVVSLASFFTVSLDKLEQSAQELRTASDVLDLLATNIPKAANYFFSYMILQALSTSSSTLLQVGPLISWFLISRFQDITVRQKWLRNITLREFQWGASFPAYTNFACIALIYSAIAPMISAFAVITFSVLWLAQRYAVLYVIRFQSDTGGVLYPRALNQTFTGLYMMELCTSGLFFIVEDEDKRRPCTAHGVLMIFVLASTVIYQILLNRSFGPLFRHIPIVTKDESAARDEEYHATRRTKATEPTDASAPRHTMDPFFGGITDTLEDLDSGQRNVLIKYAFAHEALRSRRPTIWIPQDDSGVSDDEIRQTTQFSSHIQISNQCATMNSYGGMIYQGRPPDFSALDLINI